MLLAERAQPLSMLEDMLADSIDGKGKVALVTGPVAVGKTELAMALAEKAQLRGVTVLRVAASLTTSPSRMEVLSQLANALPMGSGELLEQDTGDANHAELSRRICAELVRRSQQSPLLIVVDDIHHSDKESLQGLLRLVSMTRTLHIMVVLVATDCSHLVIPLFHAELLREPHCSRIRIGPLSRAGVEQVLAQSVGTEEAKRLSGPSYEVTGGNALVLRALQEEHGTACSKDFRTAGDSGRPLQPGDVSALAVLTSLYRSGPEALTVARCLALLEEDAEPELLKLAVDMDPDLVDYILGVLRDAGLFRGLEFRHPRAAATVLGDPGFVDRAATHYRIAEILQREGHAERSVARHLIGSGPITESWAISFLSAYADTAMAESDPQLALECLQAALNVPHDDPRRGNIVVKFVCVLWAVNPAKARTYLDEAVDLWKRGRIVLRDAFALVPILLWCGNADVVIEMVTRAALDVGDQVPTELTEIVETVAACYPGIYQRFGEEVREQVSRSRQVLERPQGQAHHVLKEVLCGQTRGDVADQAQELLQVHHNAADSYSQVPPALFSLIYTNDLDEAEYWSRQVLSDVEHIGVQGWEGLNMAIRAEIARRSGDLKRASDYASLALKLITPRAWGVAIGIPIAVLIAANTARGRYADAERFLAHPMPEELFETRYGLHYLDARARHHLAQGRYHAAQRDFASCGRRMRDWGMDQPLLVSWRLGEAQAFLGLGEDQRAESMVNDQLRQSGARHPRVRGAALRIRASMLEPHQSKPILMEAARLLHGARDRLEHLLALADLHGVHRALGELYLARRFAQEVTQLARLCGAEALIPALLPDVETNSPVRAVADPSADQLSEAEFRVAELAALGHTNREIGRKLFITVSTVEQHLTRVYRKLQVSRRTELQTRLDPRVAETV